MRAGKKGGFSRVPYVLSPARAARIRHIEEVRIGPTKETAKVRVHINVTCAHEGNIRSWLILLVSFDERSIMISIKLHLVACVRVKRGYNFLFEAPGAD